MTKRMKSRAEGFSQQATGMHKQILEFRLHGLLVWRTINSIKLILYRFNGEKYIQYIDQRLCVWFNPFICFKYRTSRLVLNNENYFK